MGRSTPIAALSIAIAGMGWAGSFALKPESAQAFNAVLYTNRAEWEQAFQQQGKSFKTEDFNDNNLQPEISVTSTVGLIQDGLWQDEIDETQQTEWQFNKPILAWGGTFDLGGPGDAGSGLLLSVLTVLGEEKLVTEISNPLVGGFRGFIADTNFQTVRFTKGTQPAFRESYYLDNVVYAEADSQPVPQPVPEPTTILGTVVLGLGGITLKRKYKATENKGDEDS